MQRTGAFESDLEQKGHRQIVISDKEGDGGKRGGAPRPKQGGTKSPRPAMSLPRLSFPPPQDPFSL